MKKLATWIGIVLVIIGLLGGFGAWAVAQHDRIEAQAEARVLRAEDRLERSVRRLETKIDFLIEQMLR